MFRFRINNKAGLAAGLFLFGAFFLLLSLQELWYGGSVKIQGIVLEKQRYTGAGSGTVSNRAQSNLHYRFVTPDGEEREDWDKVLLGNLHKFEVGGPVEIEYQPATGDSRVAGQTASALTFAMIGIILLGIGFFIKRVPSPSALVAFLFLTQSAWASTITVPGDHPAIQAAIDAASAGDVIEITPGTYNESLSITKDLTLRPGMKGEITLTGPAAVGITIDAGVRVALWGLSITQFTDGIKVTGGSFLELNASNITHNANRGIELSGNSRAIVRESSVLQNAKEGVIVLEKSEAWIEDSHITGNDVGVDANDGRIDGTHNVLDDNITRNRFNVHNSFRRMTVPSLSLRIAPRLGSVAGVKLLDESGSSAAEINVVHDAHKVPAGSYQVFVRKIPGIKGEIPWGPVTIGETETVLHLDSGIEIEKGSEFLRRWRVVPADQQGEAAAISIAGRVPGVPLPPGPYHVSIQMIAGGGWSDITPAEGIEVKKSTITPLSVEKMLRERREQLTKEKAGASEYMTFLQSLDPDEEGKDPPPEEFKAVPSAEAVQPIPAAKCAEAITLSGQLERNGERLAPTEKIEISMTRLGSMQRKKIKPESDGRFTAKVLPGRYLISASAVDGEQRTSHASQFVEVDCTGRDDILIKLTEPQAIIPEPEAEPSAWRWPSLVSEAWAQQCPAPEAGEPECPCGKMPVCVYSGNGRSGLGSVLFSSMSEDFGKRQVELSDWRGMGMTPRRKATNALTGEKMLADALQAENPCVEVISMDFNTGTALVDIKEMLDPVIDEFDKLMRKACAKWEDYYNPQFRECEEIDMNLLTEQEREWVEALKKEANLLYEQAKAVSLQLFMTAMTCPANIMLSGDNPWGGAPSLSVRMIGESPGTEDLDESHTETLRADWEKKLAKSLGPSLEKMRKSLFCECEVHQGHCVTTNWDLSNQEHRCDMTIDCCGETMDGYSQEGTGVGAGWFQKPVRKCCGEGSELFGSMGLGPDASQEDMFLRCGEGGHLRAKDLDCDGLLNAQDPTPVPTLEEMEKWHKRQVGTGWPE